MTVFAPSDATQTKKIVKLMAETRGPMYSRVGRADAPLIYKKEDLKDMKIGKGLTIKDGDDITIVACGTMIDHVLDAREKLLKEGISARIVDMHTIKPIDRDLIIKCAKETCAIITAEEHSVIGGLGSSVAEILAEKDLTCRFKRLGVNDIFCESGAPADLFEKYKLNAKHIAQTISALMKNNFN
jgi:transketolase